MHEHDLLLKIACTLTKSPYSELFETFPATPPFPLLQICKPFFAALFFPDTQTGSLIQNHIFIFEVIGKPLNYTSVIEPKNQKVNLGREEFGGKFSNFFMSKYAKTAQTRLKI